jgi:SAM-dependent methyltransferase
LAIFKYYNKDMSTNFIQSVCILGRQPELGLAELESLYGTNQVASISQQVAGLTRHASEIDFDRLGGSTRAAHVLTTIPSTDWKVIERKLPELVVELALIIPDGKIQLGISNFGLKASPAKVNAIGLTLKKVIRGRTDRSVRVTPNQETELNTAQVLHNHLVGPTGIELLLIAGDNGDTIIARTTDVQDIDSYTLRDRGRPKRDARVGMLPPKLAQIIINLAGTHLHDDMKVNVANPYNQNPPQVRLLDPFCGTGVLLQEAILLGYAVQGTDIEPRMIDYSRTNLDWAMETFRPKASPYVLEQGDATTHRWGQPVDVVACETYLGRPFTTQPSPEVIAQTASEVNLILKKFLVNIRDQVQPGTRFCLAIPAWQIRNKQFKHLPLIDQISNLGYNRVRFEHVRNEQLLYYREDQIVARELLVLTRK